MCTQRFHLLISIWSIAQLFLITEIQCTIHNENLDEKNHLSQSKPSTSIPVSKNETSKFRSVDSSRPIRSPPQHSLKSSLIISNERNRINEAMKISSDQSIKVETSTLIDDSSSTSIQADTVFAELEENPKILHRVKRYTRNDLLANNSEPERKTLLDLKKPNFFDDLENFVDRDVSIHVRVKRDNPNKDNIVPSFESNYLEDLADSFPKSEHELEEDNLSLNKVEDEKLFKRSSDSEDENFGEWDGRHSSDENFENLQNSQFKEVLKMQQENLYSDLEESLKSSPIEVEANYYNQRRNIRGDGSNENDNEKEDPSQNTIRNEDRWLNSKLTRMGSEVSNKMDRQNTQNNYLYSSKQGNFKNPDEFRRLDEFALEEKSLRFPRRGMRRMSSKKSNRRNKKKKSKKHGKNHKEKKGRKHHRSSKRHSKVQINSPELNKVIDDGQMETRIEKKDSSACRSEVDIVKRAISKVMELEDSEKSRGSNYYDENSEAESNKDDEDQNGKLFVVDRSKRNAQNPRKLPSNEVPYETNKFNNQKDASESNLEHSETGVIKSVEEIETLVDNLAIKVNELQNLFCTNGNRNEKEGTLTESRSDSIQTPKNIKRCMILENHGNTTSKIQLENSKYKLDTEINQVQIRSDEIRERKKSRRKRKLYRKWDTWTDWSNCSVSCGKGRQIRWRHCIRDCHVAESEMEEKTCQLPACPPGKFLGIF